MRRPRNQFASVGFGACSRIIRHAGALGFSWRRGRVTMVMYHAAMAVQALARSWRPATFDEVIGQDAVVTTLKNALGSDTLGQAYVFSGLRGSARRRWPDWWPRR
jgi:hypothetical protein